MTNLAERASRSIEALRKPDAALDRVPNTVRQSIADVIEELLNAPAQCAPTITRSEIQSGMDRQKWAENLILQLPVEHNGRNNWLLNYGRGEFAQTLRKERELLFNEQSQAVNPPAFTSTACTWPDCDQPSGHDFCHRHCLDNAGHPAHSSTDR